MHHTDTWAKRIDDLAKVPKIFRSFLPAEDAGAMLYAIFAPAGRWGFRKVHPKLLYLHDGCLSFLALDREGVTERRFPIAEITCVEVGRILLHAWLKISGIIEGRTAAVQMEFNSVVEDLFRPVVEMIRIVAAGIPSAGDETLPLERRKFDALSAGSYKYANFAKLSILPGEQVLDSVFEPGLRQKRLLGLRAAVPAHLAILTDRELITIGDDCPRGVRECYGGIWSYIPLRKVEELSVAGEAGGVLSLSVRLQGGESLTSVFSETNRSGLRRLQETFAAQRAKKAG
ncbi:MAG: hypothetical protein ACM3ZC_01715 [Bacteroidota bacterium]